MLSDSELLIDVEALIDSEAKYDGKSNSGNDVLVGSTIELVDSTIEDEN